MAWSIAYEVPLFTTAPAIAAGAVAFNGQAPILGTTVFVPAAAISFQGQPANGVANITLTPAAGSVGLTGLTPTVVTAQTNISPAATALAFAGFAPSSVVSLAGGNPMGSNMNFDGLGSIRGEPVSVDGIANCRGFTQISNQGTACPLSAAGWPTTDFACILIEGQRGQQWMLGTWKCGFTGTGNETISNNGNSTVTKTSAPGNPNVTFDLVVSGFSDGQVVVNVAAGFNVSGTTNGVTNVFAYLPAYAALAANKHQPVPQTANEYMALRNAGKLSAIRFMQPQNVVNNASTCTSANRNTPANCVTGQNFSGTGETYSLEYLVKLAGDCAAPAWINLPIGADNTYYSSAAAGIKPYTTAGGGACAEVDIEIGNELWGGNGGAGQNGALNALANAYNTANPGVLDYDAPNARNWNPDDYMLSDNFLDSSNAWVPEIADLAHAPQNFKGYAVYVTVGELWKNGALYTVDLDNLRNALKTAGPGGTQMRLFLQLNFGNLFRNNPVPNSTQALPAEITTNPACGNARVGNSGATPVSPYLYGFWCNSAAGNGAGATGNGGFVADWTNATVQAFLKTFANALGAHLDSDPFFEGIIMGAWDASSPCQGVGVTDPQYFGTQPASGLSGGRELILQNFQTAFPNCCICEQTGFTIFGGSATNAQLHADWCVRNGFMVGSSDSMGATGWQPTFPLAVLCSNNGQWSANLPVGATSGTLATVSGVAQHFTGQTSNSYLIKMSTGQVVTATCTNGSGTITWTQPLTAQATTNGTLINYAPQNLDIGMNTWMGIKSTGSTYTPPATPLQSLGSSFMFIEPGDTSAQGQVWFDVFTPADIANATVLSGKNGYQASHRFWTRLTATNTPIVAAQWANLMPAVAAVPVQAKSYPSAYPSPSTPQAQLSYRWLATRYHDLAVAMQAQFGAAFGTTVKLGFMSQAAGNGALNFLPTFMAFLVRQYGGSPNQWIQALGCDTYDNRNNTGVPGDSTNWEGTAGTPATIQAQWQRHAAYGGLLGLNETFKLFALKYGLAAWSYEGSPNGGVDPGLPDSSVPSVGAAISDAGMQATVTNWAQQRYNLGWDRLLHYASGIDTGNGSGNDSASPGYAWHVTESALLASGSPTYNGEIAFQSGVLAQHRNQITARGQSILGVNYANNVVALQPQNPALTNFLGSGIEGQYDHAWLFQNIVGQGSYQITLNYAGSGGTTNFYVDGQLVRSGISCPSAPSGSSVVLGTVTLTPGFHYIELGTGSSQSISIVSLLFT